MNLIAVVRSRIESQAEYTMPIEPNPRLSTISKRLPSSPPSRSPRCRLPLSGSTAGFLERAICSRKESSSPDPEPVAALDDSPSASVGTGCPVNGIDREGCPPGRELGSDLSPGILPPARRGAEGVAAVAHTSLLPHENASQVTN